MQTVEKTSAFRDGKEYRLTIPKWHTPFAVLIPIVMVYFIFDELTGGVGPLSDLLSGFRNTGAADTNEFIFIVVQSAIFLALVIYEIPMLAISMIEARRWKTVVERGGMTVTDWRGRERWVNWVNINGLEVRSRHKDLIVKITTDKKPVHLPKYFFPDCQVLVDVIVEKSKLKQTSESKKLTVFSRG